MTQAHDTRPLALAYVRVSTVEQAEEGASLDAQALALIEAAERKGFRVEVIREEGRSGKSLSRRPVLAEALARCRLDATGSLEFFPGVKSIAELQRLVAQEKDAAQPLVIWARRLLSLSPADAPSAAVVRP